MKTALRIATLFVTFAAFAQQPTRLSWQEFAKDPNRVQSFRNAVAAMKSRNSADPASVEFRKSWVYWASIHGYFGTNAKAGTVATWRANNNLTDPKWDPYFAGVPNTMPPDSVAQTVWDQCQHGTDFFFAWHRIFLYRFEQILQDAAGDPSLRLPYWDYTDPSQLAMPAEFTTPTYTNAQGQSVPNPLYEEHRLPDWGSTRTLNSIDTNIDLALDKPTLLKSGGKDGYQSTIEQRPHGYAHCAVMTCRATTMGAVPYSSNDPIFWVHHCNIDRLWDCWTSISGHTNPDSVLDQEYTFVNVQGQLVKNTVRNLPIDYVYQQPSNCQRRRPRFTAKPMAIAASAKSVREARTALRTPVLIGESTEPLAIDRPMATRRVSLPATASLSHPRQFALEAQEQLPVATELVLRGVRFRQHPASSFTIHLQRTDDPTRRALVGTLSIFSEGVGAHAAHEGEVDDHFEFDATDALRELDLEGTGTLNLDVVFEAVDEPVGEDFDPAESGLVIGEIEFHVKRDL